MKTFPTIGTPLPWLRSARLARDKIRPTEGRQIDLGALSGVAYYTVERNGFRVVATFAEGQARTPLRARPCSPAGYRA